MCEGAKKDVELDPWKHRSRSMVCATCMYFIEKKARMNTEKPIIGRCRRYAPTMKGFPIVFKYADWCGDHRLDENKV
jgi:hypothetical protein